MYPMSVDRTRKVDSNFTRESVLKVVWNCNRCQSIDFAMSVHESAVQEVFRLEKFGRG